MSATEQERTTEDLATHFDVHDPALNERVYEVLEWMRNEDEVHWVDARGGYWLVTGHDALFEVAQDWQTFSSALGTSIDNKRTNKFVPIEVDPPTHRTWRRVLNPLFSPQEADRLVPAMREIANRLIDGFAADGQVDLVQAYAAPFQGESFFRLIFGLNDEDTEHCRDAATQGVFADDPLVRREGFTKVSQFCARLYEERAERGKTNAIIRLLDHGEIDGKPITEAEARGVLELLVFGGNETTVNALSNILLHLAENDADRERVLADPTLLPHAIEESLRHDSPVVALGRTASKDVELCGHAIKAGQNVQMSWMSANHDGRAFPDPKAFDIDRTSNNHASFGVGPHRCLGSHLARAILRVGAEVLLERLPDFHLVPGTEITHRMGDARGPAEVLVAFTPAAP